MLRDYLLPVGFVLLGVLVLGCSRPAEPEVARLNEEVKSLQATVEALGGDQQAPLNEPASPPDPIPAPSSLGGSKSDVTANDLASNEPRVNTDVRVKFLDPLPTPQANHPGRLDTIADEPNPYCMGRTVGEERGSHYIYFWHVSCPMTMGEICGEHWSDEEGSTGQYYCYVNVRHPINYYHLP